MFRNILQYISMIAVVAIVFIIMIQLNNNINSRHESMPTIDVSANSNMHDLDVLENSIKLENTVVTKDESVNASRFSDCYYALLIDDSDQVIYAAKDVHRRMYPASMTKFMTASVVCDMIEDGDISLDDAFVVQDYYDLTSEDVEPCPYKKGSEVKVKDLLYGLLIGSDNYCALILAEQIGEGIPGFCDLMNQKALEIGATNSHFANPHGLDNPEHYTTAYDMYLIVKEAYSHDLIREIDGYSSYSFSFKDPYGNYLNRDVEATSFFVQGLATLPANYETKIWKTGTTSGAGNCLAMYLTKDGHDYIAICSSGESKPTLYDAMVRMLCLTN